MPLAPTWLGLGPTRRGSNPTPTFARLSASAFTRRPSFSRSCIRPADADMRQVLQCCRKTARDIRGGWARSRIHFRGGFHQHGENDTNG